MLLCLCATNEKRLLNIRFYPGDNKGGFWNNLGKGVTSIDEEVGTGGVCGSSGSEVEEGTLEFLHVTLTTENGLAVNGGENFRGSSHRGLEESRGDGV